MPLFFDQQMQKLSIEKARVRFDDLADVSRSLELDTQEIINAFRDNYLREAISLTGLSMEKLLHRLWQDYDMNKEPRNDQSSTLIRGLTNSINDTRITSYMHAIRLARNRASHLGSGVSVDDVIDSISKLIALLDWYRIFSKDRLPGAQGDTSSSIDGFVINLVGLMEPPHSNTLIKCVDNCNKRQDAFEYRLLDDKLAHDIKFKTPNSRTTIYIPAYLDMLDETRIKAGRFNDRLIVFLDNFLAGMVFDNLFAGRRSENGLGVITTCQVEGVVMPEGTMGAYFVYMLARAALDVLNPHHEYHYDHERNFCVYDFKEQKRDILLSMKSTSSTVCNECKVQMLADNNEMDGTRFNAIDQLLRHSGALLEAGAG